MHTNVRVSLRKTANKHLVNHACLANLQTPSKIEQKQTKTISEFSNIKLKIGLRPSFSLLLMTTICLFTYNRISVCVDQAVIDERSLKPQSSAHFAVMQ